ncbi:CD206 [Mytilus edulis]|uniref:MRC n=1 Tax=Mytilus edulis TaxID=6550 RepID=A0A8S3T2L4_MYTED|nr:CD206 [Mytilus edulis]
MPRLLTLLCLFGELSVADQSYSYDILPGPFTWQQGRDSCMSEGMDIAVIKDLETQNEVHNFLTTSGWTGDIWIGLFWNSSDLSFQWIGNEPQGSWSNWNTDEPDCMEHTEMEPIPCPTGFYNQNCVRISFISMSWLWRTRQCQNQYSVLCQSCTGTTIASSLSSQTTESDYDTKLQTVQHESSSQTATLSLNTSTIGKDNCKSKSNGCQCQKRMSNTTESVKITDYILIRKCEVQPLIDSGVLKVINCPFTCSCSPRDTHETNSATHMKCSYVSKDVEI